MPQDYFAPKFRETAFHCPHCSVFAKQSWTFKVSSFFPGPTQREIDDLQTSLCNHCWKYALWLNEIMISPDVSDAPVPNSDMPENVREDYLEAASISAKSPRGAAALLRLAVQKLVIHLGQKGKNLDNDIAALVKDELPVRIQKALDIVRVVGNNAVHPGVIDLNDKPETVQILFSLINKIVQDRITQPKEVDELYESLPSSAREAIEKRDTPKK